MWAGPDPIIPHHTPLEPTNTTAGTSEAVPGSLESDKPPVTENSPLRQHHWHTLPPDHHVRSQCTMADEEQPPPRKVGSLRDRIAQFEKKPETTSAPPPARPAPKQWAWKAKQEAAVAAGPPTTPPSGSSPEKPAPSAHERSPSPPPQRPAFSSNDAREAIAGGMGSLKERMAALQGRNIGGMAPAAKPKKIVIEREEPKEDEQAEPAQDEDEEEQARRARLAERMAKARCA
ncbi:hypothetical protein AG1IA_07799 [Rhizoctonia solani AG-1 IA]|uniref:Uncharacterized protein n=1 Tax=Thanatephorus cucumeris (strain AG1-IA) TaxID=983506 RepID=L8WN05_THACA|nr:hypothetical protein AG1IA_07799 [Rhizoctonia solani AG-1 IA]